MIKIFGGQAQNLAVAQRTNLKVFGDIMVEQIHFTKKLARTQFDMREVWQQDSHCT